MTLVINLGGTINTAYVDGKPAHIGIQGILNSRTRVRDIDPVSSNSLTWEHLYRLRNITLENRKKSEKQFLVTSGTDSLEELAYYLSLVIPLDVRLAVVGALRLRSDPVSDGEQWISLANEWLNKSTSRGVVVCCGGPCVDGSSIEKVHIGKWMFRELSTNSDGLRKWLLDENYHITKTAPRVPILSVGINAGSWIMETMMSQNFDGLVIEAYAAGDVPSVLSQPIRYLISKNIPVVLASKSRPGVIEPLFPGVVGCSHELLSAGVLGAGRLDSTRARIRLMVGLAARPLVSIKDVFRLEVQ